MEIIFKRPLVIFCISMVIGILISDLTDSLVFIISFTILLITVLLVFSERFEGKYFIRIGIVVFFVIGALEFFLANKVISENFIKYDGLTAQINGFVSTEPDIKSSRISYLIDVTEVTSEGRCVKKKGKVLLSTVNDGKTQIFEYGSRLVFEGVVNLPSGVRNPGGFDYKKYLARKGASAVVFARYYNISRVEGRKGSITISAGVKVRNSIARVIEKSLPRQQAGLLNGMLTGYTEGLSDEVRAAFSNAGLSHIMAVSGANVVFIIIPVIFLLKLLRLGQRTSNAAVIAFLIFFVYITGFEPSVLRAVVMAVTILGGKIIRREGDIYTTIAFSAVLLLVISPHMLFNIGFQLSYTATLSLVLFCKPVKNLLKFRFIPDKMADILAATIAAQAGVLPITAVYFNKVSVISLISNLLVVPLLEIITILGMAMAVLGHIYIGFSQLIGYLNCGLLSFVLYVTGLSSSLSFSTVKIATPGIMLILLYYAALWFFLFYKPTHNVSVKPVYYAAAALSAVTIIMISVLIPGKLEIVFLDVGEGDCAFIRTSTGRTVLIDGGGKTGTGGDKIGESVVVPFLLDMGVTKLDLVIATHGHDDHIKGLEAVLREIRVNRLLVPDITRKEEFKELSGLAGVKSIAVVKCASGNRIMLDDKTYFDVLSPEAGFSPDKASLNESSIVLKLHYGKISVLFTGDITNSVEELLLEKSFILQADVLKIAHHGSVYSSSQEFISAINPTVAVISVGTNNFGHPGQVILDRLEENKVDVMRTDNDGAIVMSSDGNRIRMHTTVQKEQEN